MKWEFQVPEERYVDYREWVSNPFPMRIINIIRLKSGSWLVIGSPQENVVYRIIFPAYYSFFGNLPDGNFVLTMEGNKIIITPEDDSSSA
jgi:hypothetical protein